MLCPALAEQEKIGVHREHGRVWKNTGGLRNALRAVHTKAESIPFKSPGVESLVWKARLEAKSNFLYFNS